MISLDPVPALSIRRLSLMNGLLVPGVLPPETDPLLAHGTTPATSGEFLALLRAVRKIAID
jgi:hypothetical protein